MMTGIGKILSLLSEDSELIYSSNDTLDNCYIIKLLNEDYTIGKILEYYFYENYFKNNTTLKYVGFLKKHPHDNFSIIKLSFKEMFGCLFFFQDFFRFFCRFFAVQHFSSFTSK